MKIGLLAKNKVITSFATASHRKLLYVLLVSLCTLPGIRAQAQSAKADLLPPRFIPKSPTVTAFQRFDTQQLVNLPTGAAQLAVPLGEVNSGTLRLPISLAYSYTGLQVYQPKELVGLGWSLQAGASISLQITGLIDGLAAAPYNPDSINTASQAFLKRVTENTVDTGPDVYSFSIPEGPSGRFILRDTTVILLPQQPVHIRLLWAKRGVAFQIATEDGIRYQFFVSEQTHTGGEFGLGTYQSAWHLTRVISTDNTDTLKLYYAPHEHELTPSRCVITTGRYSGNASTGAQNYITTNSYANNTQISTQYLDSISGRGVSAAFKRDNDTHVVRGVRVVATTAGRREIKRISFFQSVFPSVTADRRIKLDSLQESANGSRLPSYQFQYDTSADLPSRASVAQDYWGYYNGATLNGGDAEHPVGPALLADPLLGTLKANREPNFGFAHLGALTQVTYPTGGRTRWDYESGRVWTDSGKGQTIPTTTRDSLDLRCQASYDPNNLSKAPNSTARVTCSSVSAFTLTEGGTIRVDLTRTAQNDDTMLKNTYRDFNIWRREANGDSISVTPGIDSNYESAYGLARFWFSLPAGHYSVQTYAQLLEICTLDLRIPSTVPVAPGELQGGAPGGGIRVCRTRTYTPGAPPLVHSYSYIVPDTLRSYGSGVTLTGGRGFTAENFTTVDVYAYPTASVNTSSDNSRPGDELSKYLFYYSCIGVRDSAQQGATISFFTTLGYQFNEVVLSKKQVYREPFQLAEQEEYLYLSDSYLSDSVEQGFPLLRARMTLRSSPSQLNTHRDEYGAERSFLQVSFTAPRYTKRVQYDEQGNKLTTVTRSTYERQRLRQTATRTSTGWDIQRYKRLSDYASRPAVTALQVNSFNPVLETQTWHRALGSADSLLTGGRITLYDPTWRSPARLYQLRLDRPLPGLNQETQTNGRYDALLSDTRYEPTARVRYARTSGDLVEQVPTHGPPTSYLTGYQRTLVIAQAQNAPYNQVAFTSFEPDATGRWLYDSTGTHRQLGGRTGRWAYALAGTAGVRRPHLPAGDYELTFWRQGTSGLALTLSTGASQAGGQPQLVASAPGDWHQYRTRLHFPTGEGQVQLAAAADTSFLLDEVRLAPVGAQLTTYTHDPLVGITSQTDPTGRTVTYEYDGLGRLVRTRDEQGRILAQQQYHYAQP